MIFLRYADLKFTQAKEEIAAQGSAPGGRRVTGALAAVTFRGRIDTATLIPARPEPAAPAAPGRRDLCLCGRHLCSSDRCG